MSRDLKETSKCPEGNRSGPRIFGVQCGELEVISRGDFILPMKVMAPVMDEGRQAPRDSGTTVLCEEVALSSVLFFLTLPSLVFLTLFPRLSYLLAVYCRDPSAYRSLTFQTRFLLVALALSISYPQLQRSMQHALRADPTYQPQSNPSLIGWKGKRKSIEEAAKRKWREKYKGWNLGPFIVRALLLVAALSWARLCPFEDTAAHRQLLKTAENLVILLIPNDFPGGNSWTSWRMRSWAHRHLYPRTPNSAQGSDNDIGGKTVCGNK